MSISANQATDGALSLVVNGEAQIFKGDELFSLIAANGVDPAQKGLAVALNGRVVPHGEWAATKLSFGDKVEIVRPLAGG